MYTLSDKISYINSLFISSLWLGIFNGGLKNGRSPLADKQTPRGSPPHKGPDGEGAEGAPQERRQFGDRMR